MNKNEILREISQERDRQDVKWGEQNHRSFPKSTITNANGYFGLMPAARAKVCCDLSFENGQGSWSHILNEEIAEAFEEIQNKERLREELIQCAAVIVAWIESLDRNPGI